jgi:putative ABC transport system permease protein
MNNSVQSIPLFNLALAFLPVAVVVGILFRWSIGGWTAVYAVGRMLVQLLLIGYVLVVVLRTQQPGVVGLALAVMLVIASWIALRPLADRRRGLYGKVLGAITIGGGLTLILVTQGILRLEPWFAPRYVVPLAGMIFPSAMNTVSLAAERFMTDVSRGTQPAEARRVALQTAMIPTVNSLFAVGLVSLPGMMTGQVLSGVSPLEAVRYQVMVMCMIFGASGISAAVFLMWLRPEEGTLPSSRGTSTV